MTSALSLIVAQLSPFSSAPFPVHPPSSYCPSKLYGKSGCQFSLSWPFVSSCISFICFLLFLNTILNAFPCSHLRPPRASILFLTTTQSKRLEMVSQAKSIRLRWSSQLKLKFPIQSDGPALTWPNELPGYTTQRHRSHDWDITLDEGRIFQN